MPADPASRELHQHAHGAVRLRRRRGEEPVRHLALHHHAPELELRQVETFGDERRRDVVRQVRNQLVRRRVETRDVETERVAPVDVGTRDAREVRLQPSVDLDGVDVRDALGEKARQHAEPGADLQHHVVRREAGQALDHAQDVLVDEKVLAQALARCDAHRPKTRVAFSSIWRSSSCLSVRRT